MIFYARKAKDDTSNIEYLVVRSRNRKECQRLVSKLKKLLEKYDINASYGAYVHRVLFSLKFRSSVSLKLRKLIIRDKFEKYYIEL